MNRQGIFFGRLYAVVLWAILVLFPSLLYAQKARTKIETGEYQMRIEKNTSKLQAEEISIQRAKIDAIAKAFGTVLSQDNSTYIQNKSTGVDVKTESRYSYVSNSFVNGEWTQDLAKPSIRYYQKDGEDWIVVTVKGRIREIKTNPVSFKASLLSCPNPTCATTQFNDKQDFYFYFKSPTNGYLAVYMEVLDDDNTYRLLPYKQWGAQAYVAVKGDVEYIFFSSADDKVCQNPLAEVDHLFFELNNKNTPESQNLLVLFSPDQPLEKPILNSAPSSAAQVRLINEKYEIPPHLEKEAFQKWLQAYRGRNRTIQLLQMYVDIH